MKLIDGYESGARPGQRNHMNVMAGSLLTSQAQYHSSNSDFHARIKNPPKQLQRTKRALCLSGSSNPH